MSVLHCLIECQNEENSAKVVVATTCFWGGEEKECASPIVFHQLIENKNIRVVNYFLRLVQSLEFFSMTRFSNRAFEALNVAH